MCPKGTFSFERAAKDYLDCLECPAGRICEVEGLTNLT
jgi:ferredoxin-like protein FixX